MRQAWVKMEAQCILFFPIIGILLVVGESVAVNSTQRSCDNFPLGLTIKEDVVIGSFSRWENQCPSGKMIVGLWAAAPKKIMQDIKCCSGSVDQALSVMKFDFHHHANGPSQPDQTWHLQCPENHVMTGVKITRVVKGNLNSNHLSGMKCSLLINKQINYSECIRIDLSLMNSLMRDPTYLWSAECPAGAALLGLYDTNDFESLEYAKCCKIQDSQTLSHLPWTCPVAPDNLCGWSLSKDTSLTWKYLSTGGGSVHFLYLSQTAGSGSATIASPGYAAPKSALCFRLTYMIRLYASVKIRMKAYDSQNKIAIMKDVGFISKSTSMLAKKDFIIRPTSNFQITVEGKRMKSMVSTVWISELSFVKLENCNADRCSSPYNGCAENEICLPHGPQGYKDCVCKQGYVRKLGKCSSKSITTNAHTNAQTVTSSGPVTSPIITPKGDRGGGGSGKTDGGGEIQPKPGGGGDREATGGKKENINGQKDRAAFQPWVYTAVGGICGTLLVLFLVFSFLAYRKRRLTNQMYRFGLDVNYLRPRSFSGSFISDNNNSYVPEPTIQPFNSDIVSSPVDIELVSVPGIAFPDDNQSINSGSPPSHHYFEVEQEVFLDRKTSQTTLTSPMYGSSEDILDDLSACEIFLEPSSNEQELCAQLDKEIDRKDLHILPDKQLGQGAFGFVHYGTWRRFDGEPKTVAIKSMKDSEASEERIKFLQEAAIMKQFAHQNVVFMFGVVTKRYPPMIVLEYMKNGNLRKFLSREKRSRLKQGMQRIDRDLHRTFLHMAREIVAGMTYLAGMQFVHRDLAARNILLDENMVCKIGDFGLARDLIGCEHYISQGGQIPVKWTAPEALEFRRYSTASDVWSFGILLYEIWSVGKKPYENWSNDEVIENVCNRGFRLPPPRDCPRVVYHLMIDCWHPEESKRPRFSQIKYCLAQNDERLLGRGEEQKRQRSATLNDLSCETIKEDNYGELQYVYCKTD